MIKKAPIIFAPYLKTVVWGGEKICDYKGIPQKEPNIGESWEISAVPDHESVVSEGEYKGKTITSLVETFGESLVGKKVVEKYGKQFPLLIKFIHAKDNLSVQVHPNDELAMKRHGSLGKSEVWYIISSEKGAKIYSGLSVKMNPEEYMERVKNGTFEETLAVHESNPGDVFYLPAGRVHAIGAGNLLAEIQESSDITYRIYDYNRKDANGNPRELHVEQARDAIDYNVYSDYKSPRQPEDEEVTELVNSEHFIARRIKIDGERKIFMDGASFVALMSIEGEVTLTCEEGKAHFIAGQTVLVPAASTYFTLSGKAILLSSEIG